MALANHRRKLAWVTVGLVMAGLGVGISSRLHATADTPTANPSDQLLGDLVHLDRQLVKLQDAAGRGASADDLVPLVENARAAKRDVLKDFPDVLGLPYDTTFGRLACVDTLLWAVRSIGTGGIKSNFAGDSVAFDHFLKQAKSCKETLEATIRARGETGVTPTTTTVPGSTSSSSSSASSTSSTSSSSTSSTSSSSTSSTSSTSTTLGQVGVLHGTMNWQFFDATEVAGTGSFTQSPAGPALDEVKVVVPGGRTITNEICPTQLPNPTIATTTTAGDTLICSGGTLAVGNAFQLNVQTSPDPTAGMGGQLFGRQNGTFAGPFTITGP